MTWSPSGTARYESKMTVEIPHNMVDTLRTRINHHGGGTHKPMGLTFQFVSVISDGARPICTARILIDATGQAPFEGDINDEIGECAEEAASKALRFLKLDVDKLSRPTVTVTG